MGVGLGTQAAKPATFLQHLFLLRIHSTLVLCASATLTTYTHPSKDAQFQSIEQGFAFASWYLIFESWLVSFDELTIHPSLRQWYAKLSTGDTA